MSISYGENGNYLNDLHIGSLSKLIKLKAFGVSYVSPIYCLWRSLLASVECCLGKSNQQLGVQNLTKQPFSYDQGVISDVLVMNKFVIY